MIESAVLKGVGLSPGIGEGTAFLAGRGRAPTPGREGRDTESADFEIQRFRSACARSEASLSRLRHELSGPLGTAASGILAAQQLLLRDPGFVQLVERSLREHRSTAEGATFWAVSELAGAFEAIEDPYLRERAADVHDIGQRIVAELGGGETEHEIPPGSIVVARDLTPSFVARLRPDRVRGVVTQFGGKASHAAILLRSAGIPAVGGIEDAPTSIEPGSPLLVDGIAGLVFLAPSAPVRAEYARLEADLRHHDALLAEESGLSAITQDGLRIHLAATLGKAADAEAALRWNADSVGLFRTEFAFGIRRAFPTEDEQAAILAGVAERLHPRSVVIRLLDLGADKNLPYFPLPKVVNPALGLRGTRLLLAHPELLRTQLRAILRVSAAHPVSALLPMVGGLEEVRAVRQILGEETGRLLSQGRPVGDRLPLGAMIEIPSAVLVGAELAREADFLSLGSNDLAQYLLAADRDDSAMSGYFRMRHPAVLRAIRSVVHAAQRAGKELTLCGEMAGDPEYAPLLVGLGLRRFSATPRQLAELRHEIRRCHAGRAAALARRLLRCATCEEVRRILDPAKRVAEIETLRPT